MADSSRKYFHCKKLLWKSSLRVQAQPSPSARHLLSMDWVYRGKKDNEDHQQGNGSGMLTAHP
jgi:hypothetical protein